MMNCFALNNVGTAKKIIDNILWLQKKQTCIHNAHKNVTVLWTIKRLLPSGGGNSIVDYKAIVAFWWW